MKIMHLEISENSHKQELRIVVASAAQRGEDMPAKGKRYDITLIHAEDDYDIPWEHSEQVYWHAVNATTPKGISFDELQEEKESKKRPLGAGGWTVEHRTPHGVLREQIVKHGLHDMIMGYPVVSLAILKAFEGVMESKTVRSL